jgi:alpha-D-ribose 1-methylphosphonate 5-triphosphate diphosphatase
VSSETVLRNARLVLDDRVTTGAVVLRDSTIVDIDEGGSHVGEDLGGDHLLPGLVELHTDHLEQHFNPRPGTTWEPVAAVLAHDAQLAASGMTTVFDAIRVGSDEDRRDAAPRAARTLASAIAHAAGAGLVRADHYLHLRCEVASADCVSTFDLFAEDPHVRLVSLMDHTPGERQYADIDAFRRYVLGKGRVSEAELPGYIERLKDDSARFADTHRNEIASRVGKRGLVLATHDDATVAHVEESVSLGGTISEFPTTVVAARAATARGQWTVMGAPNLVRGGSHSGNVAASELLGLELLHILSSDYIPASPLQAVFQLAADDRLGLAAGAKLVSANPARALGLHDRGEIAIGKRADLVRVHPHTLPTGQAVPVVRGVWRAGQRVS